MLSGTKCQTVNPSAGHSHPLTGSSGKVVLLFLLAFPLAVRHSTGLRGPLAVVTGFVAFGVFQAVEYLLLR